VDFSSRQLRAFHLVARLGSFARAAEMLFITPSGLSLLIRELEKQLGFRLFDRTTRHVGLTADGAALLRVSERSLRELDEALTRIRERVKGEGQTITIGTTPLVAASILAPAIREYRSLRPDVQVLLFDGNVASLEEQVQAGALDIALGIFAPIAGVRRTPFFRFSLALIRPGKPGSTAPAATSWAQLEGQTLISLDPTFYPHQRLIDKQLKKLRIQCRRDQVVNLLDTQIALVEAEQGLAIVPSFGLPVARPRNVMMSRLVNPEVHLQFHHITDRGRKLPQSADEFTLFLKSYMARWVGIAGVS
jgi:LysR family transcriptional regulator, carnitine catabolism transcriptional activator